MKAVQMSYFKRKLNDISKSLYLDNDWKLPKGFIDKKQKNPLNYSRAEWQKAKRTRQNPQYIKAALQECWNASDSKCAFENALMERGYFLAKGTKSRFVAVDVHGEVYSLSRQLGVKIEDIKSKLGEQADLQNVEDAKQKIGAKLATLFSAHGDELNLKHYKLLQPVLREKERMVLQHKSLRAKLDARQKTRWAQEDLERSMRLRKGFKGLWDRLTGTYQRTRKRNEVEASSKIRRDVSEKERLIHAQLSERRTLQRRLRLLQEDLHNEKAELLKLIATQNKSLGNTSALRGMLEEYRNEKSELGVGLNSFKNEPEI
jgi:hypothetical protein